jgi:dinuclear metal center YbgI/SA1388 family protein
VTTVSELVAHLDDAIPFQWAEPWDRVGLLVGDPTVEVSGVLVSLDSSQDALTRAFESGANVVLTHHPVMLEPMERLVATGGGSDVAVRALSGGVSLIACHTNLDRAPAGADALADLLGLRIIAPLESGRQPVSVVTVYVPASALERVRSSMAAAGAGRIGEYRECSFQVAGRGGFVPGAGTHPASGSPGVRAEVDEVRLEMVCPRSRVDAVTVAVRAAHPYEEPLIVVAEGEMARGAARLGRLCEAPAATTLGPLATLVGERLGVRPTVWGAPDTAVGTIATAPGSGRSFVADATLAGADAFVTGELRYHEAREAAEAGLCVIEAGHDATEWPLTRVLAKIAAAAPGLAAGAVVLDRVEYPWWTA